MARRALQKRSARRAAREHAAAAARRKRRWLRHVAVALSSAALVGLFWSLRPDWVPEMRLWKAVGDSSYVLLITALAIGPLGKLLPSTRRLGRWRRQLGIWFAITATIHAALILHGWARWSLRSFLGYEFVPQLGREARMEPGFGLANAIGVAALLLALLLAATSSDRALRRLGRSAWAWLHRLSQTVLVLALLHGGYFLFIHFTESFHKQVPDLDWFRFPFIAAGFGVLTLQAIAFTRDPMSQSESA